MKSRQNASAQACVIHFRRLLRLFSCSPHSGGSSDLSLTPQSGSPSHFHDSGTHRPDELHSKYAETEMKPCKLNTNLQGITGNCQKYILFQVYSHGRHFVSLQSSVSSLPSPQSSSLSQRHTYGMHRLLLHLNWFSAHRGTTVKSSQQGRIDDVKLLAARETTSTAQTC